MDDVPIKGCKEEAKDLTLEENRCCIFIKELIEDMNYILKRLEDINLTLSLEKFTFGFKEIMIVGRL